MKRFIRLMAGICLLCGPFAMGVAALPLLANAAETAPPVDNKNPQGPKSVNPIDLIKDTFSKASTPAENATKTPAAPTNAPQAAIANPSSNGGSAITNAPPDQKDAIRNRAFDSAVTNVFPMTPEQIQEVMKRMSESQEAARAPPEPDPKPMVKIEDIPLDPGVQPPVIRVAMGYVTTVNILDVTGQPWPIQDVVVGGNFQVTGPNDAHVLRLIPQTRYGRGNLSVRLVGLSTPLTFRVEAGGTDVYYRYDARITQSGPSAKVPLIDRGFSGQAGDGMLMAVLAGTPPAGAQRLEISGTDGRTRGWRIKDAIYVRTPLTMLSPGWDASVRSADGMTVYMMAESPVLMLSDNGQMVRARVNMPPEDAFHTRDLQEGNVTVPVAQPPVVASQADAQNAQNTIANEAAQIQANAATASPVPSQPSASNSNSRVKIYTNGNNIPVISPQKTSTTENTTTPPQSGANGS